MRIKLVILLVLAMIGISGSAEALDFSADVVSTAEGKSFSGKIFVSGEKVRMDMPGVITISRIDKKIVWVLMPSEGMYMEEPLDPQRIAGATEKMEGEIERTALGTETLDGREATKYRVVYAAQGAGQATVFQWVDKATGIPLKTVSEDQGWSMEYKNLAPGAPQASLFEIPAGYSKFAMPNVNDMMRGAMGSAESE